ncbi:NfeD family protein [Enterococcus sp. DIV0660C]|uniref:NfeD family protein n=1 Tax=Enterococcus sp. DIV0660C TaxID=2230880 RepID=UPI001A8F89C8|nr:NfeD family protein [Enterococcus sp. DIV0660C]MBO0431646.1 NfeD family protein [Enterococcus sp. DIV0660C]
MFGGIALETIYWYTLLICAGIAVLLVVFGDIFDFDGPLDPMLLVPWLAFTSLFGYLGESLTEWSSVLIFVISAAISSVLVFLLNFYILMPMKNAEATLSSSEKTLEGQIAQVVTPIPITGMGEIQLQSVTGSINRPACFYTEQETMAQRGTKVLIIEVKDRVCYVIPYDGMLKS